jgi:hypothetical protein
VHRRILHRRGRVAGAGGHVLMLPVRQANAGREAPAGRAGFRAARLAARG